MSGIVSKNAGRASGIVGAGDIGVDAVDSANIADDAVDSDELAAGSVDTAHIATNQIDETLMKDAFVGDFTDATVTASDYFIHGDATDSGNTKKDTVQGILDLVGSSNAGANGTSCHKTSATASIVTATWTKCTWEVENYDVADDMDITTNERFTVPSGGAGKYLVHAQISMHGNDQNYINTGIYIDGSLSKQGTQAQSGGNSMDAPVTHVFELADDAYIEIFVRHNKGSNSSTEGDSARNHLSIIRID